MHAALCCCAAAVGGEESREQTLSEVTRGWMFIFRACRVISQQRRLRACCLHVCLCEWVVRVSLCVTISARVRETWPAVPYIPQGSPRGQCAQREIRAEGIESGQ